MLYRYRNFDFLWPHKCELPLLATKYSRIACLWSKMGQMVKRHKKHNTPEQEECCRGLEERNLQDQKD